MRLLKTVLLAAGLFMATAGVHAEAQSKDLSKMSYVTINTDHGDIVVRLFPEVAPKHVESFRTLTEKGFYNGLKWHRVVPGFVVQGGDPDGNGTGGPGYTIDAEFNDKPHKRGTVAAARSQHKDSAGSQFYIVLDERNARHLDGQYTVFGEVISGMDAVDAIKQGDLMNTLTLSEDAPSN